MERNEFIVTLKNLKGIGNKTAFEICEKFFSDDIEISKLFSYIESNYTKLNLNYDDILNANFRAKNTIKKCSESNIFIVNYLDEMYPRKLRALQIPPILLFFKGKIEELNNKPSIAIIGTREPSSYGIEIAKKYSGFFAEKGFNIVSGLAKGIDGICQQSALDSNGYTVAFLAQGLNTEIYPKENRELANEILFKGGALVSEYEIDEKPNRNYFIERDRLQSGVSDAVLVIETGIVGGTMYAVNSIISLNRILAVFDHPLKFRENNPKSFGNQMLIDEKKAFPLFSKDSLESISSTITKLFTESKNGYEINSNLNLTNDLKVVRKVKNKKKDSQKKTEDLLYDETLFGKKI